MRRRRGSRPIGAHVEAARTTDVVDESDESSVYVWPPSDLPDDEGSAERSVPLPPISEQVPPEREPDPQPAPDPAPDLPLRDYVIALDPGHNGGDFDHPAQISRPVDAIGFTKPCNTTGTATVDGFRESTVNLELSTALADLLRARGAEVHLTPTDDQGVGPCIDVRGTFGTAVGADVHRQRGDGHR